MVCRFILGRAGGGKTYYCLSRLAKKVAEGDFKQQALLIVPEQSTFVHEARLMEEFKLPGFTHVGITSFQRLVYQARRHRSSLPVLSESGKLMLMAQVVADRRGDLQVFQAQAGKSGFLQSLIQLMDECKDYGINPAALFNSAMEEEGRLKDKLADLALLYQGFQDLCQDTYSDPQESLGDLARAITEGDFLAGEEVYLDGFAGFTPQEEGVLAALFQKAKRVEIALALDPALARQEVREGALFYPLWRTYRRLHALADSITEIEAPYLCLGAPGRFQKGGELDFVEKHLYPINLRAVWEEEPAQIRIRAAADPQGELKAVGGEILRLVREEGYRFREISIIARSTKPYEGDLERIFEDLGIPYFVDGKKPLVYHPLSELLASLWDIAALGWHYQYIFRFLKNPLSPLKAEECDWLENYCLACGIRHYDWESPKPWRFWPRSLGEREGDEEEKEAALAKAEELRQKAAAPLRAFCEKAREAAPVGAVCLALQQLLEEIQAEARLEEWAEEALLAGRGEEAAIHSQAWAGLERLLGEAGEFLGTLILKPEELGSILKAGLEGLSAALIPPGLDQVFVAAIDRSRNPEVKAAFILGVNAGEMPKRIVSEGLLSSGERQILAERGLELAPDDGLRQLGEDFLVYVACTRASQKLYLSYSHSDGEGKSHLPSPVISRFLELFPALKTEIIEGIQEPNLLTGGTETLAELALALEGAKQGLGMAPFWGDVYNWYISHPEYQKPLNRLLQGLYFEPLSQPLAESTLAQLYPRGLGASVSRLEKYRACPFAYFASYGLKLKKRRLYQLTPMDRGLLFHEVLADIGRTLGGDKDLWEKLDRAKAQSLVQASLERFLPLMLGNILASSSRYAYLAQRLENTLVNTLLLWAEHMRKGDFAPIGWELTFGKEGALPALVIPLEKGRYLELSGVIDRVDAASHEGQTWLRVVDYKTGREKLRPDDIWKGLKLQLLVYLQVVLNGAAALGIENPAPAGIYYSWVRDDLTAVGMPPPGREEVSQAGLRLEGITVKDMQAVHLADKALQGGYSKLIPVAVTSGGAFYANSPGLSPEELKELQEYLFQLLQSTAGEMLEGLIQATPQQRQDYDVCKHCDYPAVCGFSGEAGRKNMGTEEAAEGGEGEA